MGWDGMGWDGMGSDGMGWKVTIGEDQHDNVLLRSLRLGLRGTAGGSIDNGCKARRTEQLHELHRIQIRP